MSKHTPGPWRVEMEDGTPVIWAHPHEYDIAVVAVDWEPVFDQKRPIRDNGTASGNARLIAASPDLLAACEAAFASESCVCAEIADTDRAGACLACVLFAAIAKARGWQC